MAIISSVQFKIENIKIRFKNRINRSGSYRINKRNKKISSSKSKV